MKKWIILHLTKLILILGLFVRTYTSQSRYSNKRKRPGVGKQGWHGNLLDTGFEWNISVKIRSKPRRVRFFF